MSKSVSRNARLRSRRQGWKRTGHSVVSPVLGTHTTVAVTIETRHGLLGEEGEGLFEDCRESTVGG